MEEKRKPLVWHNLVGEPNEFTKTIKEWFDTRPIIDGNRDCDGFEEFMRSLGALEIKPQNSKNTSRKELIALIKGLSGYESYAKAEWLNGMGAGKLYGFPNETWVWFETFFDNKTEEQLLEFYNLLKSWIK